MYATFEEFIDHQQSPEERSLSKHSPSTINPPPPPPAPSGGIGTKIITSPNRSNPKDIASDHKKSGIMSSSLKSKVHLPLPINRFRHKSPPTVVSDDLALASPRRSRRRRPRRLRRSVDNPLLETISAIGGDSDEDISSSPYHYHNHHPFSHFPASCPRLHGDTDLIGYAGCNSVDSGYKSACPTPDFSDLLYPEHRLEKRGSLASLASSGSSGGSNAGSKPRIAMGTRVMSHRGGLLRSPGSGGLSSSSKRVDSDGAFYEFDQIASLCQSFLTSPTENDGRTLPGDIQSSPGTSTNNVSLNLGSASKSYASAKKDSSSSSPERRPRSASIGSRCSNITRVARKTLQTHSPILNSTSSLPRASSPVRRPSLSPTGRDDKRPPPAWSRHSSPGIYSSGIRGRRPPSPIVGVDQDKRSELVMLEKEIDALLYGSRNGASPFYDIERGQEFTYSYEHGKYFGHQNCHPSNAAIRKLREDLLATLIASLVNENTPVSDLAEASSTAVSATSTESLSSDSDKNVFQSPASSSGSSLSSRNASVCSYPHKLATNSKFCSYEVAKSVLAMLDGLPRPVMDISSKDCNKLPGVISTEVMKELELHPLSKQCCRALHCPPHEVLTDCTDCMATDDVETVTNKSFACSDYHLYEEIVYEASTKPCNNTQPHSDPPPLPKRPPLLFKPIVGTSFLANRGTTAIPQSIQNGIKCKCPNKEPESKTVISNFPLSESTKSIVDSFSITDCKNSITSSTCSKKLRRSMLIDNQKLPVLPHRTSSQSCPIPTASQKSSVISNRLNKIPRSHGFEIVNKNQNFPYNPCPSLTPTTQSKKICAHRFLKPDTSNAETNDSLTKCISPFQTVCILSKETSSTSTNNKPKQRNNFYSIFSNRQHRQCLSASLEIEYNSNSNAHSESKEESKSDISLMSLPVGKSSPTLNNKKDEDNSEQITDRSSSISISANTSYVRASSFIDSSSKEENHSRDSSSVPDFGPNLSLPVQPKALEKPLVRIICKPNDGSGSPSLKGCSLDFKKWVNDTQREDDYGFKQGFPHVV